MSGLSSARRWTLTLGVAAGALLSGAATAEEQRVRAGATYVADVSAVAAGGIEQGLNYMGLLEAHVDAEGEALGLDGVIAHASVQWVHGRSLSGALVGDAQVVSNIDAVDALRLFEAWLRVPVARDGYVKAGLIDLNGEFDVQEVGALFLNSSHGIGPDYSQSGRNGPSIFPATAAGAVAGWEADGWSLRLGAFDAVAGDPDRPRRTVVRFPGTTGVLIAGEVDVRLAEQSKLRVGAWGYTSRFEPLEPAGQPRRRGNRGAYAMVEGALGTAGGEPIEGWLRLGVAEDEFNPIGTYLGGGLAIGHDTSRWGLAVAHARLGGPGLRRAAPGGDRAETAVELTYSGSIGERVRLQPDVQYVINPGWDPTRDDALVVGVRVEVSLF